MRNSRSKNLALVLFVAALACTPPTVEGISQEDLLSNPPPGTRILDVRSAEEFASGHVPDAIHIPHDELAARLSELGADRSAPVVVYCERGRRAGMAGSVLLDAGFENVLHLDGDMAAWRASGRPTTRGGS